MKPLNIAMIGYGGIGRVHALAYRAIPFHYGLPAGAVNIVGVATTRPETAWEAGQEIGCDVWTTDYHELLARDDVDVVDVCVPNRLHEEVVIAAAAGGQAHLLREAAGHERGRSASVWWTRWPRPASTRR